MATTTIKKYASVIKTLGLPMPSHITDPVDAARVAAYDAYDDMYANVPQTFKLAMRGTNDNPVYVPSTQRIVETTNRYLGVGWNWTITSAADNAAEAEAARAWLATVYTNNKMPSKLGSFKRGMLKRGDAIFHVIGHPDRPQGSRVQVLEIHPRTYFPIPDPTDPEGLLGVYILSLITVEEGGGLINASSVVAMRQSYRYETVKGKRRVFSQLSFFEPNAWDDRFAGHEPLRPVAIPSDWDTPAMQPVLDGVLLPETVTRLPVYHAVNNRSDEETFGTAEVAGMETLVAAMNQAVSDEDITLALQGLGIYVTDSAGPKDEDGNETDWIIQPGYVIELKAGEKFTRVDGITNMEPFQDHIKTLSGSIDQSGGLSAVAVGNVDAATAASGVALRLDMAPILAKNSEKEGELLGTLDQLGNDLLQMWSPVDSVAITEDVTVADSFDDPLPVDRTAVVAEITALVTAGLMSKEFALTVLKAKLGYDFPSDMLDSISADADAESARVAQELAAQGQIGAGPPDPNADPNQAPSGQPSPIGAAA